MQKKSSLKNEKLSTGVTIIILNENDANWIEYPHEDKQVHGK